jgi:hypothetical protein
MRFRPSFRNSGSQSFSTFCMLTRIIHGEGHQENIDVEVGQRP